MKRFKIDVTRNGKLWCEVSLQGPDSSIALKDVLSRFPASEGFDLHACEEVEVSRIVEAGQTARVLGITYEKIPLDNHDGFPQDN